MDTTIPFAAVVAVIALAMVFNYTNGFHDAANAIATSVSTRALTPRVALAMAAVANLFGAFFGSKVAATIGSGIIAQPEGIDGMWLVVAALVGAIAWNLITWWFGLPSSSSHALIGGLCGAALVAGVTVHWGVVWSKVIIPMVVSPVAGLAIGYLVMAALFWVFRRSNPSRVTRGFRLSQTASAAAMAFGHGLQDAAKTAGVVVLVLNIAGLHNSNVVPIWVLVLSAVVISLGTYAGGWRVMRTLGRRIIDLTPPQGFASETTAASILYVAGLAFGAPISTTHTITAAIMGVGATKRISAVRWSVANNIVGAWFLTFPGAGLVAVLTWYLTAVFR
ncbi:low-affinity phosphate transporter PitH [Terrabacter lapilli]|uniref:Low-affinity phosphate transporter PitH n=1 Tax=Terrabacter lapilli TaxID=436231 RepID=A0ABN2SC84_9MICO